MDIEDRATQMNEELVRTLENEEAELIAELKDTTSAQMAAYQGLREACLVSSPEEFKAVYMGTMSNPNSPRK